MITYNSTAKNELNTKEGVIKALKSPAFVYQHFLSLEAPLTFIVFVSPRNRFASWIEAGAVAVVLTLMWVWLVSITAGPWAASLCWQDTAGSRCDLGLHSPALPSQKKAWLDHRQASPEPYCIMQLWEVKENGAPEVSCLPQNPKVFED